MRKCVGRLQEMHPIWIIFYERWIILMSGIDKITKLVSY